MSIRQNAHLYQRNSRPIGVVPNINSNISFIVLPGI